MWDQELKLENSPQVESRQKENKDCQIKMVLLRKGLQSPVSPCNVTLDSVLLWGKYFHVAQHAPGSWLLVSRVSACVSDKI